MIIPVKKSRWQGLCPRWRTLKAGLHRAVQYDSHGEYWVCFKGDTSPRFKREYQACTWFRERVEKLLEGGE